MFVRVKGERAMFGDVMLRQEGGTYPWPTPSALSGMLKQVYWHSKPYRVTFDIHRVKILSRIARETVVMRELNDKINLKRPLAHGLNTKNTQFRASVYLRDVDYAIDFSIGLIDEHNNPVECKEQVDKTLAILSRRLKKGTYFETPYLGRRECPIGSIEQIDGAEFERLQSPYAGLCGKGMNMTYSQMLCHIHYDDENGKITPLFADVSLDDEGVINYPDLSARLKKLRGKEQDDG